MNSCTEWEDCIQECIDSGSALPEELQIHIADCESCSQAFLEYKRIHSLMSTLPQLPVPADLSSNLISKLRQRNEVNSSHFFWSAFLRFRACTLPHGLALASILLIIGISIIISGDRDMVSGYSMCRSRVVGQATDFVFVAQESVEALKGLCANEYEKGLEMINGGLGALRGVPDNDYVLSSGFPALLVLLLVIAMNMYMCGEKKKGGSGICTD